MTSEKHIGPKTEDRLSPAPFAPMMVSMATPVERMEDDAVPPADELRAALDAPPVPYDQQEDVTPAGRHAMEDRGTDELVTLARGGDREAYAMLFGRFHDEIYRFATRRLGDPASGQDAAADTFADAFGGIHRFQFRGVPFEAWLYTIARRRIADQLRKRARSDRMPVATPPAAPDHSGAIVDTMHMRGLIARLPESERDVVELRFMEDLDVEQTALRLDKKPGAVRVAQHRALQHLRRLMAEGTA